MGNATFLRSRLRAVEAMLRCSSCLPLIHKNDLTWLTTGYLPIC